MCRAWFAGVLLAAACSFEAASLPTGFADAPVFAIDASIVDVPGAGADAVPGIDAPRVPDAAIVPDARICIPGCVSESSLRVCPSDTVIDCVLGCVSTGTPHCGVQIPSNGIDATVYNGTGPFVVPAGRIWRVNVDSGEIVDSMSGQVRPGGTGVDAGSGIGYFQIGNMGVFAGSRLAIENGATLRAFGLVRSLAVVTSGNAVVDGLLSVSGESCNGVDTDLNCAGPGGGRGGITGVGAGGCAPGGPGQAGAVDETGGGGGGFGGGGGGGPGGDVLPGDGTGGDAGSTCGTDTLVPLVGGSGGGRGGNGGNGGGGGGAVQITSFGQIIVSGTIEASGAGGLGGGDGDGGGGGGAGGGILLEAPGITFSPGSVTAANGGGGGAGNGGGDGQTGLPSAVPAPGGMGGFVGGAGGARGVAAMPGSRGMNGGAADGTGAGGGGIGRVRFNFATLTANGTVVSPAESQGKVPVL